MRRFSAVSAVLSVVLATPAMAQGELLQMCTSDRPQNAHIHGAQMIPAAEAARLFVTEFYPDSRPVAQRLTALFAEIDLLNQSVEDAVANPRIRPEIRRELAALPEEDKDILNGMFFEVQLIEAFESVDTTKPETVAAAIDHMVANPTGSVRLAIADRTLSLDDYRGYLRGTMRQFREAGDPEWLSLIKASRAVQNHFGEQRGVIITSLDRNLDDQYMIQLTDSRLRLALAAEQIDAVMAMGVSDDRNPLRGMYQTRRSFVLNCAGFDHAAGVSRTATRSIRRLLDWIEPVEFANSPTHVLSMSSANWNFILTAKTDFSFCSIDIEHRTDERKSATLLDEGCDGQFDINVSNESAVEYAEAFRGHALWPVSDWDRTLAELRAFTGGPFMSGFTHDHRDFIDTHHDGTYTFSIDTTRTTRTTSTRGGVTTTLSQNSESWTNTYVAQKFDMIIGPDPVQMYFYTSSQDTTCFHGFHSEPGGEFLDSIFLDWRTDIRDVTFKTRGCPGLISEFFIDGLGFDGILNAISVNAYLRQINFMMYQLSNVLFNSIRAVERSG